MGQREGLKYYIHDGVGTLRLQLLGDLRETDLGSLNGTWETAKTTLGTRKLVLDLRQLHSVEDAGREWLKKMIGLGASTLPESYFEPASKPSKIPREVSSIKLSLLGRVLGMVRGEVPSANKCR